jgi:hypothetical protein
MTVDQNELLQAAMFVLRTKSALQTRHAPRSRCFLARYLPILIYINPSQPPLSPTILTITNILLSQNRKQHPFDAMSAPASLRAPKDNSTYFMTLYQNLLLESYMLVLRTKSGVRSHNVLRCWLLARYSPIYNPRQPLLLPHHHSHIFSQN